MISSDNGVSKPDPRSLTPFIEWTGKEREECVFLDDLEANNVSSAFRMGWKVIGSIRRNDWPRNWINWT